MLQEAKDIFYRLHFHGTERFIWLIRKVSYFSGRERIIIVSTCGLHLNFDVEIVGYDYLVWISHIQLIQGVVNTEVLGITIK